MRTLGWLLWVFFVVDLATVIALLLLTRLTQRTNDAETRRLWREAAVVLLLALGIVYGLLWLLV